MSFYSISEVCILHKTEREMFLWEGCRKLPSRVVNIDVFIFLPGFTRRLMLNFQNFRSNTSRTLLIKGEQLKQKWSKCVYFLLLHFTTNYYVCCEFGPIRKTRIHINKQIFYSNDFIPDDTYGIESWLMTVLIFPECVKIDYLLRFWLWTQYDQYNVHDVMIRWCLF